MAALESAPLLGGAAPPRAIRKSDGRVVSLDQFRGATMLVMLIVNFSGNFAAFPRLMKHGYGSQATIAVPDLVMPCFLFCVGFAFRITSPRRVSARGSLLAATWGKRSACENVDKAALRSQASSADLISTRVIGLIILQVFTDKVRHTCLDLILLLRPCPPLERCRTSTATRHGTAFHLMASGAGSCTSSGHRTCTAR